MVRSIGVGSYYSQKKNIKIGDTALARTITVKKMELNAAADNFSKEERNNMRDWLDVLDKEEEEKLASIPASLPALSPAILLYADVVIDQPPPEPEGQDNADDEEGAEAPV